MNITYTIKEIKGNSTTTRGKEFEISAIGKGTEGELHDYLKLLSHASGTDEKTNRAISFLSRFAPCPHMCIDTNLGNGKIWAKCEDCGETFHQDKLANFRREADEFEKAIDLITEALKR